MIDSELEVFKELHHNSELWHEANKLRTYLKAFEKHIETTNQLTQKNIELLQFGFQKADWMDPLIKCEDELFSDLIPYNLINSIKRNS